MEIFWVGADTTWSYFTFGYSRSAGQTSLLQLQWSPLLQLQFTLMLFCLYISRTTDGRWHNTGKQLKIWQLRITWKSDFVRKKNLNLERFFPKNEAVGLNCCKFMVASYWQTQSAITRRSRKKRNFPFQSKFFVYSGKCLSSSQALHFLKQT